MSKILLDYVFPISIITPTPAASTAFLKQVCLVVKPKSGQEANVGEVYECTTTSDVSARTNNTNATQFFTAGMTKVFILLANHLGIADALEENRGEFWTVIISDDFVDDDLESSAATLVKGSLTFTAKSTGAGGNDISVEFITGATAGAEVVTVVGNKISVSMGGGTSTATQLKTKIDLSAAAMALINAVTIAGGASATTQAAFAEDFLEGGDGMAFGTFDGVIGVSSTDADVCGEQAVIENRVAFFCLDDNGAENMCYAFGKLLSNLLSWGNQQYIAMPFNDEVDDLGEANTLFDDKVSFVLNDEEFGNRLGLFAVGGKAIVSPYILKNLRVDLQSRTVQWISANQPNYTLVDAALLEARLQDDVIQALYIEPGQITAGTIEVKLEEDNFVASGYIDVADPKALWRVFGEMRQTL